MSAPARGPRAGQKVLMLQCAMPRDGDFKQTLCADNNGFSLHAAARCGADDLSTDFMAADYPGEHRDGEQISLQPQQAE